MSVQENYQQYRKFLASIEQNPQYQKNKTKNRQIIQDKQLISYMNDTKWIKLQHAVQHLDFPPAYIVKLLTEEQDEAYEINFMENIPTYWGNWNAVYEEGMPFFFNIEYMIVQSRLSKHQGMLIDPLIQNECDAFRKIINELGLVFQEKNYCFKICAYHGLEKANAKTSVER